MEKVQILTCSTYEMLEGNIMQVEDPHDHHLFVIPLIQLEISS